MGALRARRPVFLLFVHWLGATNEVWVAPLSSQSLSGGRWILLSALVSGAGSAWTAIESFFYWTAARRRLAHGLADPLVVNRIALWGVVGVSTVVIDGINFVPGWRGVNVLQDPVTMIGTGVLGLVNAIALWLAFAPPAASVTTCAVAWRPRGAERRARGHRPRSRRLRRRRRHRDGRAHPAALARPGRGAGALDGARTAFVCAGGYPMLVLAFVAPGAELRFALAAIAIAAVHAGLGCIFGFTRRVFRPDVAWLRGAAVVLALVLAVVSLGTVAAYWEGRGTLDAMMKAGEPWAYATNGIGDVIFAWTALESFRYWNLLRRRVPLGLADPLVANRFFLWGVFGAL